MDTLTIDGVSFPVSKATFATNGRTLELDVRAGHASISQGHDWWRLEPRLYAEVAPIAVDPEAAQSEFAVDSPALSEGEWLFCLYMFEHEWVTECRGAFYRDAHDYRLEATGHAEVMGEAVAFAVATRIKLIDLP